MKTHRLTARRTAQRPRNEAQLAKLRASCEHLPQTPGLGLVAAATLDLTPGSSRGCKPGLPTIARQSVRLWFQLRCLLRTCLAVGKEREETSGMVWIEGKSNAGPEGSSRLHSAWRALVSYPPLAQCPDPGGHRPGSSSAVALPHCNKPPASVLPGRITRRYWKALCALQTCSTVVSSLSSLRDFSGTFFLSK